MYLLLFVWKLDFLVELLLYKFIYHTVDIRIFLLHKPKSTDNVKINNHDNFNILSEQDHNYFICLLYSDRWL